VLCIYFFRFTENDGRILFADLMSVVSLTLALGTLKIQNKSLVSECRRLLMSGVSEYNVWDVVGHVGSNACFADVTSQVLKYLFSHK